MEETGAFFEPTLAALFIHDAFSPKTQRAVCESSSSPHVSLPLSTQPFSSNSIHCALLDGLHGCGDGGVRQSQRERCAMREMPKEAALRP